MAGPGDDEVASDSSHSDPNDKRRSSHFMGNYAGKSNEKMTIVISMMNYCRLRPKNPATSDFTVSTMITSWRDLGPQVTAGST